MNKIINNNLKHKNVWVYRVRARLTTKIRRILLNGIMTNE